MSELLYVINSMHAICIIMLVRWIILSSSRMEDLPLEEESKYNKMINEIKKIKLNATDSINEVSKKLT